MSDRLIIILGMVQSGTTILTHVLRQHPQIYLCPDDNWNPLLENDWLVTHDLESISCALGKHSRVLLKRPMRCVDDPDWLVDSLPEARYVYCWKPLEDILVSWAKPKTFIYNTLKSYSRRQKQAFYLDCLKQADSFSHRVQHFIRINHCEFLKSPQTTINKLVMWLGLPSHSFDTSCVSEEFDIKSLIGHNWKAHQWHNHTYRTLPKST